MMRRAGYRPLETRKRASAGIWERGLITYKRTFCPVLNFGKSYLLVQLWFRCLRLEYHYRPLLSDNHLWWPLCLPVPVVPGYRRRLIPDPEYKRSRFGKWYLLFPPVGGCIYAGRCRILRTYKPGQRITGIVLYFFHVIDFLANIVSMCSL